MRGYAALLRAVHACAGRDVLVLSGALLAFCRKHKRPLSRMLRTDAGYRVYRDVGQQALTFFKFVNAPVLDEDQLRELDRRLRKTTRRLPAPIIAFALAEALDDTLGHFFFGCFHDRGERSLEPGEPFVLPQPGLREVFDASLNAYPDNVDRRPDATRRVRLFPQDPELEIGVSFRAEEVLDRLGRGSRIGFAFPNRRICSNHAQSEIVWDRYERGGRAWFFRVRPRDPKKQLQRIRRILDRAGEQHVEALVFPELCVTPELVEPIRAHLVRQANGQRLAGGEPMPRLVVLGSAHEKRGGKRWNRSTTLLWSGTALSHCKFEPFSFRDEGDGSARPADERHEDVEHVRALTVHFSPRWSLAILICRDIMPLAVVNALVDLGVRIVLVPALSAKTDLFEVSARTMTAHAQSIVAVANAADAGNPAAASAIASVPLRDAGFQMVSRTGTKPPSLLWFKVGSTLMIDACHSP